MEMTFSHLLPGFAGFAATVVTPWYSADPGSIRNSIVLILSFVLLVLAIVFFLRSLKEKGKQVSKQSQATESQMFQTLELAIEEGRTSLDLDADHNADPDTHLDVAASPNTHQEIPSPLAELALQFDKALPEPNIDAKTQHVQIAQSDLNGANGTNGKVFAHPPPNPARPETAHVETANVETARASLPRLSELRGMRFSQALRELDRAKRSAPPNDGPNPLSVSLNSSINDALADRHNDMPDGALDDPINDGINEALMSVIAPFEAMFAPTASAPDAQNGAQGRPPQQPFFPMKLSLPANSKGRRREDGARSPDEPKAPEKETNAFLDQLHILPSRRGQYKKKG